MRLRNNILLLFLAFSGLLPAGEWTTESAGFEFDPSQGCGKLHGPLTLKFGGWTFSAAREALVTAKGSIVKKTGSAGGREYGLVQEPARVVFLGRASIADKDDKLALEAPFLILSMVDMTVVAKGSGIALLGKSGKLVSTAEDSMVVIDVETGRVARSGDGW